MAESTFHGQDAAVVGDGAKDVVDESGAATLAVATQPYLPAAWFAEIVPDIDVAPHAKAAREFPAAPDVHATPTTHSAPDVVRIAGVAVGLGDVMDIGLEVSQEYSGAPVTVPIRVWRAPEPGPTVGVIAAVHGDEINGTGIIRALILDPPFDLARGTLVLVPVVNILGFDRHTRNLPDRRDLNRSFPGHSRGSLTSRYAHTFYHQVVKKLDVCIDLHSAGRRRTNFPNVRADLTRPDVKRIAMAFGCELVVNGKGPRGSLRRTATRAGCATIILEAGEVWKIEPSMVEIGVRGVHNVLVELGMVEGERYDPPYQARVYRTTWVRSDSGGTLTFHVGPGDPVNHRQALVTVTDLLGHQRHVLRAPRAGIVMGLTTWPAVKPGDPVCHLAIPHGGVRRMRAAIEDLPDQSLNERVRSDLATSVSVSDHVAARGRSRAVPRSSEAGESTRAAESTATAGEDGAS